MREHIRRRLDDEILRLYREMRDVNFPLVIGKVMVKLQNCRCISYDDLARAGKVSYRDVVSACRSLDGCTQYDPKTGRYLIAINTSDQYSATKARIRWTTAHELGHILAGHFVELAERGEKELSPSSFDEMEEEADYFAASLLAPIPAMKLLWVKRPAQIRDWFGLSQTAAEYRWADFQRDSGDPRLEEHFRIFFPRSETKYMQMLYPKKIDVVPEPGETVAL